MRNRAPDGRSPRATPACRDACWKLRTPSGVARVTSHKRVVASRVGHFPPRDLLHDDRPPSPSVEAHLLVVPLLGRASDPGNGGTRHCAYGRSRWCWGGCPTVGHGRGCGRRRRPGSNSRLVARRGRSRRQPVQAHARRGDPRRRSTRDARPQAPRRVTPPRLAWGTSLRVSPEATGPPVVPGPYASFHVSAPEARATKPPITSQTSPQDCSGRRLRVLLIAWWTGAGPVV